MTSVAYVDETRELIARLEAKEAHRQGSLAAGRRRLAGKLGVMAGTLETLARGRLKRICGSLHAKAKALLIHEIEREIAALTHELDTLRQVGAQPHSDAVAQVEAHLAAARSLLRGAA